mmetsp:Transcript_17342/g.53730  ORF Transcript_17342/g.53730 Transcript_17342/m.53730 type:complete len:230 (-) Transcript_17342:761-1450(-)
MIRIRMCSVRRHFCSVRAFACFSLRPLVTLNSGGPHRDAAISTRSVQPSDSGSDLSDSVFSSTHAGLCTCAQTPAECACGASCSSQASSRRRGLTSSPARPPKRTPMVGDTAVIAPQPRGSGQPFSPAPTTAEHSSRWPSAHPKSSTSPAKLPAPLWPLADGATSPPKTATAPECTPGGDSVQLCATERSAAQAQGHDESHSGPWLRVHSLVARSSVSTSRVSLPINPL